MYSQQGGVAARRQVRMLLLPVAIFDPQEIEEWIEDEDGDTAFCPCCEIDSVLPESGDYPLTKDFLRRMYDYWF